MTTVESSRLVDARSYVRAILNILEDAADEKTQLGNAQRAALNILDEFTRERVRVDATQRAVLNILEDASEEKARLADNQRAILNILEDAGGERRWLEATQRAIMNILEDSAAEKARLSDTQRAALNVLDDFDIEKKKVEQVNVELRSEIAERARVEEALRSAKAVAEAANKELEAFSYSVAHDLRAPLRSIDGFSQAMLEDYAHQLDKDGRKYLHNVRDSARQMGELIDALLNLARVTRTEVRRVRVDVSKLAHEVVEQLQAGEPQRNVDAVIEEGLVAHADPRLLELVLVNLLGNAWKFTSKRSSARIELATTGGAKPIVYFVRDNGAGFNPAYAAKLFGVFQRLHAAHEFEGTGIGLATVQRIVQRHGGRVWAEGQIDRGATFYFTLEQEGQT